MRTFNINEPEGWFNRLARHVLVAGEGGARGPAKDVVLQTITTPFGDPRMCVDGPTVGRQHVWYGGAIESHAQDESVMSCSKCGAQQRIVWRDQPSFGHVLLGRR